VTTLNAAESLLEDVLALTATLLVTTRAVDTVAALLSARVAGLASAAEPSLVVLHAALVDDTVPRRGSGNVLRTAEVAGVDLVLKVDTRSVVVRDEVALVVRLVIDTGGHVGWMGGWEIHTSYGIIRTMFKTEFSILSVR
jgi:hypothetical protein